MNFLVFGDIHDKVERVSMVLRFVEEEYGLPKHVLITGDYGEKDETVIKIASMMSEYCLEAISIYGNHEPKIIREKVLNNNNIFTLHGIKFLPLGVTYNCCGVEILGIGGNRGSGKKWSHWQDSQILRIMETVGKVDIILAHEMPYGAADKCRGKHCGQIILRKLTEKLRPKLYVGGHLHTLPEQGVIGNTIVLKVGCISNKGRLKDKSFFTIIDMNDSVRAISGSITIRNT